MARVTKAELQKKYDALELKARKLENCVKEAFDQQSNVEGDLCNEANAWFDRAAEAIGPAITRELDYAELRVVLEDFEVPLTFRPFEPSEFNNITLKVGDKEIKGRVIEVIEQY